MIVTVEKFIIALQSHKMVMCVSKFMTMTQLSGRQTSMRVDESCHTLLQRAFERALFQQCFNFNRIHDSVGKVLRTAITKIT